MDAATPKSGLGRLQIYFGKSTKAIVLVGVKRNRESIVILVMTSLIQEVKYLINKKMIRDPLT